MCRPAGCYFSVFGMMRDSFLSGLFNRYIDPSFATVPAKLIAVTASDDAASALVTSGWSVMSLASAWRVRPLDEIFSTMTSLSCMVITYENFCSLSVQITEDPASSRSHWTVSFSPSARLFFRRVSRSRFWPGIGRLKFLRSKTNDWEALFIHDWNSEIATENYPDIKQMHPGIKAAFPASRTRPVFPDSQ